MTTSVPGRAATQAQAAAEARPPAPAQAREEVSGGPTVTVGLITPDPGHPLLAGTAALLRAAGHAVRVLRPGPAPAADPAGAEPDDSEPLADVYLLKSRTPHALRLAAALERRGAPVVNPAAATAFCQDRTAMAERALCAGLPFAPTRTYPGPAELAADPWALCRPLVVKSRHSRKHDIVVRLDTGAAVRDFAARCPDEPLVAQEFAVNGGWDHKLWCIGGQVFAALRRSELSGAEPPASPVADLRPEGLPEDWLTAVRRTGVAFGLEVYGVDVVVPDDGPALIVDINAFPGVRDQPGAPEALSALALATARARRYAPRPV